MLVEANLKKAFLFPANHVVSAKLNKEDDDNNVSFLSDHMKEERLDGWYNEARYDNENES